MTEKQKLFQELNDRMVKDLGIKETNKIMENTINDSIVSKDYVLYDRANNSLVKFDNGDIVLYGDKDEAMEDCYGNEEVIQFEKLPKDKQKEITNQLNIKIMEYNTKIYNEDITIHYHNVKADDGIWIEIDKIIWDKNNVDIAPLFDDYQTWIDEINDNNN